MYDVSLKVSGLVSFNNVVLTFEPETWYPDNSQATQAEMGRKPYDVHWAIGESNCCSLIVPIAVTVGGDGVTVSQHLR